MWRPDDPPERPEHIYILRATPDELILFHCSQNGGGRAFSLILRRTPSTMAPWDWYDVRKVLFTFQLPNVVRYLAICDRSGGHEINSGLCILVSAVVWLISCVA